MKRVRVGYLLAGIAITSVISSCGGGSGGGIVSSSSAQTSPYNILYSFGSSSSDAYVPDNILASNNMIYGVSFAGGTYNGGTLFGYNLSNNSYTILHDFGSYSLGAFNPAEIVISNGLIYGITQNGGLYDNGTLFVYNPSNNSYYILHSFGSSSTGAYVPSSITIYGNTIYGATLAGGAHNDGTLFEYNLSNNSYTVLYSFGSSSTDGVIPAYLVLNNNMIYGVSQSGGMYKEGTLFEYNLSNNSYAVLYSFGSSSTDGANPFSLISYSGVIYGVSFSGGKYQAGTLFSYSLNQ